jgi:hypothetical protein
MTQELLGRVHRELLDVLKSINQDEIHDDGHDFHKLLKDVEKALAQPEQEPVAKVIDWGVEGPRLKGLTEDWPKVGTLLYTHPPQENT